MIFYGFDRHSCIIYPYSCIFSINPVCHKRFIQAIDFKTLKTFVKFPYFCFFSRRILIKFTRFLSKISFLKYANERFRVQKLKKDDFLDCFPFPKMHSSHFSLPPFTRAIFFSSKFFKMNFSRFLTNGLKGFLINTSLLPLIKRT